MCNVSVAHLKVLTFTSRITRCKQEDQCPPTTWSWRSCGKSISAQQPAAEEGDIDANPKNTMSKVTYIAGEQSSQAPRPNKRSRNLPRHAWAKHSLSRMTNSDGLLRTSVLCLHVDRALCSSKTYPAAVCLPFYRMQSFRQISLLVVFRALLDSLEELGQADSAEIAISRR